MESESNVRGEELEPCGTDPMTGAMRDGYCYPLQRDPGRHEICAVMTEEFLQYSKGQGNDLVTPRPDLDFPGLEPGDHWCVCVPRWMEAESDDRAPPVVLEATSEDVLEDVPLSTLEAHEHDGGDVQSPASSGRSD
ncbi:DUF2237 family protein [Haloarcula nitratireducens]|uniref:DUF2237 domain-containing protein n=1 Tax=Haloarcula nitratireducens TaxID=2487749 RepID=A0AAW4P9I7_9EURY|nr:DUF2237 domain-containing protein [Halomicroarcula nitratireducens]MBX0294325.1 DUF2237 domain-containing protein [Halomicroarcula nitratireducens]